jgi:hypothetical protein
MPEEIDSSAEKFFKLFTCYAVKYFSEKRDGIQLRHKLFFRKCLIDFCLKIFRSEAARKSITPA